MKLINPAYSFASAYLKGEEARCVTAEHIEGMLQRASVVADSLDVVRETDLGEFFLERPIKHGSEVDERLWDYLALCRERLQDFRLPRDMSRLMTAYFRKYDILNVKIALRKVIGKEVLPFARIGDIHDLGYLDELMVAESMRDISDVLVKSDLIDYVDILDDIKDIDRRSLIEGEAALDNRYYRYLLQTASGMIDGGILVMAITVMIDTVNLAVLLRTSLRERPESPGDFYLQGGQVFSEEALREMASVKPLEIVTRLEGSDYDLVAQEAIKLYEKTGMISAVDKAVEKERFRLLQELLSPRALSPCNLLWYFVVKELEMRNVRLVLKTSADGVEPSAIRDLLVTLS